MLLPVRKEVAEFYQHTMRQVQENQQKHVQEVMSATRSGRVPPTAVRSKTGVRASLEQVFLMMTISFQSKFQPMRCQH